MKKLLSFVVFLMMSIVSWAQDDMLGTPLTLEAIEPGEITFDNKAAGPVMCRVNGGEAQTIGIETKGSVTVNVGDKVAFYGDNGTYAQGNSSYSQISCTNDCYIYGNVMSLISSTDYASLTSLEIANTFSCLFSDNTHILNHPTKKMELPATTLANYCYDEMFSGCTGLTKAPELPATTLTPFCYSGMFWRCTGLTKAPELPATTLTPFCYSGMFRGCTSMTEAPALPATWLVQSCYQAMFADCTSLAQAPELPAIRLYWSCYSYMFMGCTSLAKAPALPATELEPECYSGMFSGCTILTEAPVLPAPILNSGCYNEMFSGCKNLKSITCLAYYLGSECTKGWLQYVPRTGTFNKVIGVEWPTGIDGIPNGWDVSEVYPGIELEVDEGTPLTLEAIESGEIKIQNQSGGFIYYRINGKSFLPNGIKCNTTIPVNAGDKVEFFSDHSSYYDWQTKENSNISCTSDCYIYGNIMSLISYNSFSTLTTLSGSYTFYGLFKDNTHIKNHPTKKLELPATTLAENCYESMFSGCTSLTKAPALPATMLADYCYASMFKGCTGLTEAADLPATTLAEHCCQSMFYGCTSLTVAPALPATTLETSCYQGMFYGCTGLIKAPELPGTTLARYCYGYMFRGCMGLTKAPALPATTLISRCYQGMFYGCTGLTKAPELPATTLADYCYSSMFNGCINLSSVTCLATDISAKNCTSDWLKDVASTGTFIKELGMNDWPAGDSGIPEGWTVKDYDPTNITTATAAKVKGGKNYDLRGVKTSSKTKGLRIENGRKIATK